MVSNVFEALVHVVIVASEWRACRNSAPYDISHLCIRVEVYFHFSCQCLNVANHIRFDAATMFLLGEVQEVWWVLICESKSMS